MLSTLKPHGCNSVKEARGKLVWGDIKDDNVFSTETGRPSNGENGYRAESISTFTGESRLRFQEWR